MKKLLGLQTSKVTKVINWIIWLFLGIIGAISIGGTIIVIAGVQFGWITSNTPIHRVIKQALSTIARECYDKSRDNPNYPATELIAVKGWGKYNKTKRYRLIDLDTGLEISSGKPCLVINYSATPKDDQHSTFNMNLKHMSDTQFKKPFDLTCSQGSSLYGCINGKWELE